MFVRKQSLFAILSLAFLAAACGDDPAGPGDDHGEPEAVRVLVGGTTIVAVDEDGTITGHFDVAAGEELDVTVQFLDHDGEVLSFDADEFFLDIAIADESIAHFHRSGQFTGHVEGVAVGETTATIRLMHGNAATGQGHPDFETPAIELHVE